MNALARADADQARGDLGSARRRLTSRAAQVGCDPELCSRIAHLCLAMQDPSEAGRWFFLSNEQSELSSRSMQDFVHRHKRKLDHVFAALPRSARTQIRAGKAPAHVRQRLEALIPGTSAAQPKAFRRTTWRERLLGFGCLVGFVTFVLLVILGAIVGAITAVGYLLRIP